MTIDTKFEEYLQRREQVQSVFHKKEQEVIETILPVCDEFLTHLYQRVPIIKQLLSDEAFPQPNQAFSIAYQSPDHTMTCVISYHNDAFTFHSLKGNPDILYICSEHDICERHLLHSDTESVLFDKHDYYQAKHDTSPSVRDEFMKSVLSDAIMPGYQVKTFLQRIADEQDLILQKLDQQLEVVMEQNLSKMDELMNDIEHC